MAKFDQQSRPLRVSLGRTAPDAVLITALKGRESVSRLFQFTLDLVAHADNPLKFEDVLGQTAVVGIDQEPGKTRRIRGIVSRLSQVRRDNRFVFYRAELVPPLWLLTKQLRSRIFQQKPVKEIFAEVIGKLYAPKFTLDAKYFARNYCAQYRESDFAFLSRLMEEEGIFYYFTHAAAEHGLVIADSARAHEALPDGAKLTFQEPSGEIPREGRITQWEKAQTIRTAGFALTDHSFELPTNHLEATEKLTATAKAGSVTHQLAAGADKFAAVDYPGGYVRWTDGIAPGGAERAGDLKHLFDDNARVVKMRMEAELAGAVEITGGGTYCRMAPGYKFALAEHFDADGDYVITSVEHDVRCGLADTGSSDDFTYSNTFTCIPAAIPFRPARETPRPTVKGTQTAVVIGGGKAEIDPDRYGRVKVLFRWDPEGPRGLDSSCWVRVAQFWAGRQWGTQFIPRVGDEVVVAFLEGDPDQPIIIGSVNNAENMPLYTLPKNRTQSGIKTHSSPGGDSENFNELRFEDKKGQEQIVIHAEKDMSVTVEDNHTLSIGGGEKSKDPKKTGTSTTTTFGDTKHTITMGDFTMGVDTGNAAVTVNKEINVKSKTEFIRVASPTKITLTVKGDSAESSITITPDSITLHSPHIVIDGTTDITVVTPTLDVNGKETVKIYGPDVSVDGTTKAAFGSTKGTADYVAAKTASLGVDKQSSVVCDMANIAVSGMKIQSCAKGNHEIQGSLVKIN
jgi:type VI secretion system secreted protein VgrG